MAATLRGTENLLMDLYDEPEEVLRLIGEIETAWYAAYDDFSKILHPAGGDMGWTEYSHGVSDHDVYEPIGEALAGALEEDVFWMYLLEETDLTDTAVREIQEFCMAYADYLSEEGLEKLNSFTTELL